jgi:hypothetical protein
MDDVKVVGPQIVSANDGKPWAVFVHYTQGTAVKRYPDFDTAESGAKRVCQVVKGAERVPGTRVVPS